EDMYNTAALEEKQRHGLTRGRYHSETPLGRGRTFAAAYKMGHGVCQRAPQPATRCPVWPSARALDRRARTLPWLARVSPAPGWGAHLLRPGGWCWAALAWGGVRGSPVCPPAGTAPG